MFVRNLLAVSALVIAALAPAMAYAHYAVYVDPETAASFTATNASTPNSANTMAKAGCIKLAVKFAGKSKGARCQVLKEGSQTGFIAIAWSDSAVGFGLSDNTPGAERGALESCNANTKPGTECAVVGHWEEHVGTGRKASSLSRTTSQNVVRCSNQCFNGSCTRTFEDGRKEKWQAPRKFDPFTSNWGWDTTTNACGI